MQHGDHSGRHYDRENSKLATLLFYFHKNWYPHEKGGWLDVFTSENDKNPVCSIPPIAGHAVLLGASPASVAKNQNTASRKALALQFFRE
jgi:Rps23 Pro-64 3,4-dihydroxylase Tpa1-like proline 4-hydroxylase